MASDRSRLLIRGGTLITMDPNLQPEFVGDVLIEDGKIAAIGPSISGGDAAEVIDATGKIVTPGLVDTHRHLWQSLFRYIGADWTIGQYQHGMWRLAGPCFTPDDLYVSIRLGLAEALDSGITQIFDWNHNLNSPDHADATVAAHRESGMRVVLGYGQASRVWLEAVDPAIRSSTAAPSEDVRRLRREYYSSEGQLLTLALAARGPEVSPMPVVTAEWALARDLGLRISVHIGNGTRGLAGSIHKLESHDLLGPDTTYVHCNTVSNEEIDLIAASGGTASCAPEIESHMGHGYPAVERLVSAGVRPSLSVDTCTNVSGEIFSVMRSALATVRAAEHARALATRQMCDKVTMSTLDVLEFATLQGARANGLGDVCGMLRPGLDADLVVFSCDRPNMFPMSYAAGSVVMGASAADVETVMVRGRLLKRNAKLVGIDLVGLRERAQQSQARLLSTMGGQRGRWLPPTDWKGQSA